MTDIGWARRRAYRRLTAAVLLQACRDSRRTRRWRRAAYGPGDPEEARVWLCGPQAQALAEELGLAGALERWLDAGAEIL